MLHPFQFMPPDWRKYFFWPFFSLTLVLISIFVITGAPLETSEAPFGIVSFEIAGSVPRSKAILASWDSIARERATFGLGLDFLFIPLYAGTIALGCAMTGDVLRQRNKSKVSLSGYLAWGVLLAGLLDVVENTALTVILFGSVSAPWPQIAAACAVPKFILIFFGLTYVLLGAVLRLIKLGATA